MLAAARDITRRKKAEEKLRNTLKELAESEKRLKSIIETEPECVKILDCEGRLVEMNRAGLDMIEAESLEKVQQRSVLPIIAPEYRSAFQQMLQRVIHGAKEMLVFEIIGLKGTHRCLETHSVPLQNAENEIIGLLGVTRDITKRKKLEDDLVFERNKFDFILQKLPVGVSVLDADHKFIYVNPPSMKLDGYPTSPRTLLGEHVIGHHKNRDHAKVEQLLTDEPNKEDK